MLFFLAILLIVTYRLLSHTQINRKKIVFNLLYLSYIDLLLSLFLWHIFDRAIFNVKAWLIPTNNNLLNAVLSLLVSLILFNLLQLYLYLIKANKIHIRSSLSIWQKISFVISTLIIFVGTLLTTSSYWVMRTMGNVRFDQIIYVLSQPLTGTDPDKIKDYIADPLLNALFITSIICSILYFIISHSFKRKQDSIKKTNILISIATIGTSLIAFIGGLSLGIHEIGYADVKAYYFESTKLYDDYYVDPRNVDLKFPEKKRNLIYIFLESMESSYTSVNNGGIKEENLIPNLTNLGLFEGINFSNSEDLGGMMQIPGANQTASSMVAQTSGLPLRATGGLLDVNQYGKGEGAFFPGAYSLGEILDQEGYEQMLFIGSKASFAGRGAYFTQHGNYEIRDYDWAKENNLIPDDYYVWWGYEDQKLFDFAKDSLTELSDRDKPFNFTMLTTDTHFENGYATDETEDLFGDQYSNVIHDSDKRVFDFLEWIKDQSFYDNTTIIVVGDHLIMDKDFFDNIDPDYQRSVYNVVLNANKNEASNKERLFSAVDMFPTTLSVLNVEIPNDRLGIGTDLFSETPTLMEKMGYESIYNELSKRSSFYDKYLMQGSDYEVEENNKDK